MDRHRSFDNNMNIESSLPRPSNQPDHPEQIIKHIKSNPQGYSRDCSPEGVDGTPCGEEALAYYAIHIISPRERWCGYIGSTMYFDHYGSFNCTVDSTETVDLGLLSHPKECGHGITRKYF